MIELLLYPVLAGMAVAGITGPLGAFVVWQRMAYFGESLAHAAVLGVALGFLLQVPNGIAVTLGCTILALLLSTLQRQTRFSTDTLLGILSHTLLAGGLVAISLMPDFRLNLEALLFGDILAVGRNDVYAMLATLAVLAIALFLLWPSLIAMTIHAELAEVEGIAVARTRLVFMLMMAISVAVAMKVVGVLLITSLLVIPAAIAHRYSRSPEQMATLASIIGALAIAGGLLLSWYADTPAGPSIVLLAGLFFLNSALWDRLRAG